MTKTLTVTALSGLSVFSSVTLILTVKLLFNMTSGSLVFTVLAFHTLAGYAAMAGASKFGVISAPDIPLWESIKIAGGGVASIAFMNLSLKYNSVGTYQLFKLLCIPAVLLIRFIENKYTVSRRTQYALALCLLGVGVATVQDVSLSFFGLFCGAVAVVTTAQYQHWQGSKQSEFRCNGAQLLYAVSKYQAAIAIGMAATTEWTTHPNLVGELMLPSNFVVLMVSSVFALMVNLTSMALIGKTSAVTYQVVGHLKTALVLLGGVILYPSSENFDAQLKHMGGAVIAMIGVVWYSKIKHDESVSVDTPVKLPKPSTPFNAVEEASDSGQESELRGEV